MRPRVRIECTGACSWTNTGPELPSAGLILVVDDEPDIRRVVRAYLERDGFSVITAGDGAEALRLARQRRPNAVVLDLMLPEVQGLDVCRQLRADSNTPVLMLTARDDITDKVVGLQIGADDYVTKPFDIREVVARVHALLRRAANSDPDDGPLRVDGMTLDPGTRQVRRDGEAIELTKVQFELLASLMRHPGRVFTREALVERIVDDDRPTLPRSIDSHIRNLRKRIEPMPSRPRYVLTVPGVGYRFAQPTGG